MTYNIVDAQEFLTGNVADRLEVATTYAEIDSSFLFHEVPALTNALPTEVDITDIDIRIGATWIPTQYYEEFCAEVFNEAVQFFYSPLSGSWDVRLLSKGISDENVNQYGFSYRTIDDDGKSVEENIPALHKNPDKGLFTMALHFKAPSVRVRKTRDGSNEKDEKETSRAVIKQEQLQSLWSSWCKEGDRGLELGEIYNRKINRTVLPNWDGRGQHLKDPLLASGMSPKWVERFRPYQLDSTWFLASDRKNNKLLGLEVGLGKTAVAIAAAQLRKYYKVSRKALFVVQRSTLKQFFNAYLDIYPRAKVLCSTPNEYTPAMRQRFLARAAFWDWDAIILTHEQLGKIPIKAATEMEFIEGKLEIIEEELERLYEMGEQAESSGKKRGNRVVKRLEQMRNRIYARIEVLQDAKDSGIYFEDVAPNLIVVDEAQKYKNNSIATKLQVTGLNISESDRAQDFDLKLAFMREKYKSGFLWMMTGTPEPTNSMTGVYVFQRYLQPEQLAMRGLSHFDAWAMNFGRVVSEAEFKANGTLKITDRFCEFVNLPELLQMWLSCCYIKRYEDVANQAGFTRPEPKLIKVMSDMSEFQKTYMNIINVRYRSVCSGDPNKYPARDKQDYLLDEEGDRLIHPVTKDFVKDVIEAHKYQLKFKIKIDNHLWINTDCRKLMVASQLIDPELPVEKYDKIAKAARRIYKWWKITKEKKSTQLVFLDWGTPGGSSKFCLYDWLKAKLLEYGVPEKEIAFIQNYSKDEQKEELFCKVNAGDVRVLIGSTQPMGIGVNVQQKVIAIHFIDIPRRPDEYEQRLGRAIRSGNENKQVVVYQYLTKGQNGNFGANAYELQLLEKKMRTRESALRADPTVRRIVEDNNQLEVFMKLKAHASGDERILDLMNVTADLDKAENRLNLAQREVNRISSGKKEGSLHAMRKQLHSLQQDLVKVEPDVDKALASYNSCASIDKRFACTVMGEEFVGEFTEEEGDKPIKAAMKNVDKFLQQAWQNHIKEVTGTMLFAKKSFTSEDSTIGEFGGFPIVCRFLGTMEKYSIILWLQGSHQTYAFEPHTSEQRLIRNLITALGNIIQAKQTVEKQIGVTRDSIAKAESLLALKRQEVKVLKGEVQSLKEQKIELQTALNMEAEE